MGLRWVWLRGEWSSRFLTMIAKEYLPPEIESEQLHSLMKLVSEIERTARGSAEAQRLVELAHRQRLPRAGISRLLRRRQFGYLCQRGDSAASAEVSGCARSPIFRDPGTTPGCAGL